MTIKCIRCGNIEESAAKYVGVWDIKYGVNGTLYDNEHFVVGLCPDCRIGCKDNLQLTEKGYTNLLGCLTTIEKRTAKLERELDRVWEVIRCMGEK